jgi:hypothetical protein
MKISTLDANHLTTHILIGLRGQYYFIDRMSACDIAEPGDLLPATPSAVIISAAFIDLRIIRE